MEHARNDPKRLENLPRGEKHWNWSDRPTVLALHKRIHRKHGAASKYLCVGCGQQARDWSLNGTEYTDRVEDYSPRCRSCRVKRDDRTKTRLCGGQKTVDHKLIVNGRYVGDLINGTLIKKGKQVQKMYAMDGFGIASQILDENDIEEVQLHYEGKVYEATIREVRRYGIPYKHPRFEKQIIMPAARFRVRTAGQLRLV